jgi:hypothetical protein
LEHLSRRHFLQITGIALLSRAVAFNSLPLPDSSTVLGRALTASPIYRHDGVRVTTLWHNSVVRILDADPQRYRLPQGFVHRQHIQPMIMQPPAVTIPPLPFWAEVSGPVAVIRAACAADAEQISSIGHGGVMSVIERLPDGSGGVEWYGIAADDGTHIGWSQASAWRPIIDSQAPSSANRLNIDLSAQRLTAFDDDQPVFSAPISTAGSLQPGYYRLRARRPGGCCGSYQGAPWHSDFDGGVRLAGVYWHNQFGSKVAGHDIHTTPLLARWLHDGLSDDTALIVH